MDLAFGPSLVFLSDSQNSVIDNVMKTQIPMPFFPPRLFGNFNLLLASYYGLAEFFLEGL